MDGGWACYKASRYTNCLFTSSLGSCSGSYCNSNMGGRANWEARVTAFPGRLEIASQLRKESGPSPFDLS